MSRPLSDPGDFAWLQLQILSGERGPPCAERETGGGTPRNATAQRKVTWTRLSNQAGDVARNFAILTVRLPDRRNDGVWKEEMLR